MVLVDKYPANLRSPLFLDRLETCNVSNQTSLGFEPYQTEPHDPVPNQFEPQTVPFKPLPSLSNVTKPPRHNDCDNASDRSYKHDLCNPV